MVIQTRNLKMYNEYEKYTNNLVNIIGCGSIGSHIGIILARMGFSNFALYDDDIVAEYNIANQCFNEHDIGEAKIDILANRILDVNKNAIVRTYNRKYGLSPEKHKANEIIICCADNHNTRREAMKESAKWKCIFIEGRMGLEDYRVYALDKREPNNNNSPLDDEYLESLDRPVEEIECTAKSVIYTVYIVSAVMARTLLDILCNGVIYKACIGNSRMNQLIVMKEKKNVRISRKDV